MIDAESLRAFLAVAELGHFVHAADRLGVAQSVVSKRLMRLEDMIGTRLVERGKRNKISLTRSGALFLPEARAAITALMRAELLGRKFGRGTAGPIRIGYVFSAIMAGVLQEMIRTLAHELPELEVHPVPMETPEQINAIQNGEIDIGVCRPRPTYPHDIVAQTIHKEGIIAAFSDDHPLAGMSAVRASDIVAYRIIIPQFHEEVGLIDVIRGIAIAAGTQLPDIHRTSDFITAAGLAASGAGIAIAPRCLMRLKLQNLVFREIADHSAQLHLIVVSRPDLPSAIGDAIARLA